MHCVSWPSHSRPQLAPFVGYTGKATFLPIQIRFAVHHVAVPPALFICFMHFVAAYAGCVRQSRCKPVLSHSEPSFPPTNTQGALAAAGLATARCSTAAELLAPPPQRPHPPHPPTPSPPSIVSDRPGVRPAAIHYCAALGLNSRSGHSTSLHQACRPSHHPWAYSPHCCWALRSHCSWMRMQSLRSAGRQGRCQGAWLRSCRWVGY